jgi:thermostable 8-oxoguanine DNA glycosylase
MSKTVVDLGKGYVLTESDLKFSRLRHKEERDFIGVKSPVDAQSVYKAFEYSILTAAQNTSKLIRVYDNIKRHGMDNPENVAKASDSELRYLLDGTRFHKVKFKRFKDLPVWWEQEDSKKIVDELMECINNKEVRKQKCIRHVLDQRGPEGLSRKCASLAIQSLFDDLKNVYVGTIDLWWLRALKNIGYEINGHEIEVPDGRTVSGLRPKDYLGCERIIEREASRFGTSPGELSYALWCKYALIDRSVSNQLSMYS